MLIIHSILKEIEPILITPFGEIQQPNRVHMHFIRLLPNISFLEITLQICQINTLLLH